MARLPVALGSNRHRSLFVSAERVLNWMPEKQPGNARSPVVLVPTPGLVQFCDLVEGPVRGLHVMGSYLYAVSGAGVYRVDRAGVVVNLGFISDGGAVSMDDNGSHLAIVVPETQQAWVATSTTLTQITDPDFPGVTSVAHFNGYHLFSQVNSGRFVWSALRDATNYDAVDYAEAEGSPDNLVAVRRVGAYVWMFGETSIEIHGSNENADLPFARVTGGMMQMGVAGQHSIAVHQGKPYWIGQNRQVYTGSGSEPTAISTPAVDQALAGYTRVTDARMWSYDQDGHAFIVCQFPTATSTTGATWVYDVSQGAWHERESEGYSGRWRAIAGGNFAGAAICGDAVDGRLYAINPTIHTESGDAIVRQITTAPQMPQAEGRRVRFLRLHLDASTGEGLVSGIGSDPQIWLQSSDDGGATFGAEQWRDLGAIGQRRTRVVWDQLGMARAGDRVFRLGMSDPVRCVIAAMNLDIEIGTS